MATPRYLSQSNGFIPSATGQVISYIRNEKDFKVNKYTQLIQTPTRVGVYARIDRDQSARVVTDAEFVWADGDERPSGKFNQMAFEWVEFATTRRDYAFQVGNQAIEQAKGSWNPLPHYTGMVAQQAMTNRTSRVITLAETASNWALSGTATSHAADANTLNGGAGNWVTASDDPASPNYNAIRKSLLAALVQINLDTNALVQPKDLELIISPALATKMSNTGEINNFYKFGPFAKAKIEGDEGNPNANWGLPPSLYGIDLVVEDAVRVSTRPNADGTLGTRAYVKSDTSAILLSRKGGIDGQYGAPSFSTLQVYYYKYQMRVLMFEDQRNERKDGHVEEDFKEVLAAPETGFLLTNVS